MEGKMIFIIFAWIFFLICGGIMMLSTYLIFGRKNKSEVENSRQRK